MITLALFIALCQTRETEAEAEARRMAIADHLEAILKSISPSIDHIHAVELEMRAVAIHRRKTRWRRRLTLGIYR